MCKISEILENKFKPMGIVAFSFCCGPGCTGTYDEESSFRYRDKGIFFIRLHLSGMNFYPNPTTCSVYYSDFEYLIENWEEEKNILHNWCEIIGLLKQDYKILEPKSEKDAITINIEKKLLLEDEFDDE